MPKILVVDDSPTELFCLTEILKKYHYEVLQAMNGEDGILMAKKELPDLILMDIIMPKANGFKATRQITRSNITKDIPIIIVSTKDQEKDQVWGKRQRAVAYLTKPIKEMQLINAIKQHLKIE